MRTTININEQILAIAKQKAADRKTTLGAIIEDALRKAFSEKKKKSYVHLISAGGSGLRHGGDLVRNDSELQGKIKTIKINLKQMSKCRA